MIFEWDETGKFVGGVIRLVNFYFVSCGGVQGRVYGDDKGFMGEEVGLIVCCLNCFYERLGS